MDRLSIVLDHRSVQVDLCLRIKVDRATAGHTGGLTIYTQAFAGDRNSVVLPDGYNSLSAKVPKLNALISIIKRINLDLRPFILVMVAVDLDRARRMPFDVSFWDLLVSLEDIVLDQNRAIVIENLD